MIHTNGDAEIRPALFLSTAHMPESEPDFGDLPTVEYEFGYLLFMTLPDIPTPGWLVPIMDYARDNGCMIINFDRDEDTVERFPVYEW